MTGFLVVSAQGFADTHDQQHTQDYTSSSPFENNNTSPEPQHTSTHTTGSTYNSNTNHGGNSDDVPEDMD